MYLLIYVTTNVKFYSTEAVLSKGLSGCKDQQVIKLNRLWILVDTNCILSGFVTQRGSQFCDPSFYPNSTG